MSWLPVVLIPGLLMLATFGLQRIESSLDGDSAPADVAEFLTRVQAEAGPRPAAAPAGRPCPAPSDYLFGRRAELADAPLATSVASGGPTRAPAKATQPFLVNPQDRETSRAHPV